MLTQLDTHWAILNVPLPNQERVRDSNCKVLICLEYGRDNISRALPDWFRHGLLGFLTGDMQKELFDDLLSSAADPNKSGKAVPDA